MSVVVCAAWSFIITFLILQIISFLPFIKLRLSEKEEEMLVHEFNFSILFLYVYNQLMLIYYMEYNLRGMDLIELSESSCNIVFY